MCGIVGILGKTPVALQIVDALKRLEYRGYDSAGVATLEDGGRLERRRAEGKLGNLEVKLSKAPLSGAIGIGHTRWATHGRPNERTPTRTRPRSSPSSTTASSRISASSRTSSGPQGVRFETETDTEVVAQLVTSEMRRGKSPMEAVAATLPRLRGAFALAFLFAGDEDQLIGARHGPPLAVGHGEGEMYLGSDAVALAPFTDEVTYLEDGDWAVLSRKGVQIRDLDGRPVDAAAPARSGRDLHGREGQPPPFHGQGDLRAARGRRPHARPLRRLHGRQGRAAGPAAVRLQGAEADVDLGLRHRLLRRADRQVLVRAPGPPAGRDRRRLRVPLPRAADGGGAAGAVHLPVRRDRRHARLAALRQGAGAARRHRRQRADLDHGARERRHRPDARRHRDRGRLDQGLHLPAHRAALPRDRGRPRARHALRDGGGRARQRAHRGAGADGRRAEARAPDRDARTATSRRRATCSISAAAPPTRWRSRAR